MESVHKKGYPLASKVNIEEESLSCHYFGYSEVLVVPSNLMNLTKNPDCDRSLKEIHASNSRVF